ncbi:MAG: hypothetical protein HC867_09340 [Bacteroidia bacterium]|nr:hypothetical protein [Bacteroidia bacterium]
MNKILLMNRKKFIQLCASTAAGMYLPSFIKPVKKKVLILGGTNFVGPYIIKEAVAKDWDVTIFNRGITNPQLFPELKK